MSLNLKEGFVKETILHPFLYLLVVEGINVLMNETMKVGLFTGYSVG